MIKLLLIILIMSLPACASLPKEVEGEAPEVAKLVHINEPFYFFELGNSLFMCKNGPKNKPVKCIGQDNDTQLMINYECDVEGILIANCKPVGGI